MMPRAASALLALLALTACDEKPQKNPFDPPKDAPKPVPALTAAAAPQGPPTFEIDQLSAKVGYERALLDKSDGHSNLIELLKKQTKYIEGDNVSLLVARDAKLPWVSTYIDELAKLGAKLVTVKSETRKEFTTSLPFSPELTLKTPRSCSVVAMVLEDRGTAVWKLSGGTAVKHSKGMAGPDLSMTGDNIERAEKGCKDSTTLFVSAGPSVEWGLVYDLAASSKTIEKSPFDSFVLLGETAVPGHKIDLRKP
jgi:hypothetical protein